MHMHVTCSINQTIMMPKISYLLGVPKKKSAPDFHYSKGCKRGMNLIINSNNNK